MKNERGYTLVIVLLIITLIFSFSLVLIGDSVNSAKQNNKTESNYRATHIAEMGITYVQEKLMLVPDDHLRSNDKLKAAINVDNKVVDPDNPLRQFNIDFIGIDGSDTEKTLKFKSVGSDDGNEAELTASMVIKIPENDQSEDPEIILDPIEGSDIIDFGENVTYDDWRSLSEAPKINLFKGDTIFSSWISMSGPTIIRVTGDADFGNSFQPKSGSIISILGSSSLDDFQLGAGATFQTTSFSAPLNNTHMYNGSELKVCSDAQFNTATFHGNNKINICNDADFTGYINFTNSTIVNVKNNATIGNEGFQINNNSTLNIGNDFTVTGQAVISSATIRVFGDANLKTGINQFNNSHLFVYGHLILGTDPWQFLSSLKTGVCAKKIVTNNWPKERRDDLKIQTITDKTSCDGLDPGVYELPNLQTPNKDDYFEECTDSCRINGPSESGDPTIELDNVTY